MLFYVMFVMFVMYVCYVMFMFMFMFMLCYVMNVTSVRLMYHPFTDAAKICQSYKVI